MSTAGGALLGSVLDARFDGTVGPFAQGVLVYGLVAAAGIFLLGLRRRPELSCRTGPIRPVAEGQEAPLGHIGTLTGQAGLAQLAEHLTCNHEVAGSTPAPGS